jgi:hypothetical protein
VFPAGFSPRSSSVPEELPLTGVDPTVLLMNGLLALVIGTICLRLAGRRKI